MPKPDNSLQARLDRAIASGGSKVLIANLQKQLGISGGSSTVPTGGTTTGGYTTDQQNFENGWQAYTGAQKSVYDLETSRGIEQYDLKQQEYQKQIARNREDYARYTSDAQTQMNRQLGQSSKEFSRKLASASNAYGQRGILRSGFAKSQLGEAATDFQDSQTYFKTQTQRQIEAQQQGYDRQYSDISTNAANLAKQKEQYQGDRNVGKQVLDTQLQYQGDTQYNTLQTSQYQTNQALLAQEARNNRYGVQSNASKRTWRIGGSYTS